MEKNIEAGLREDWFDAYLQPIYNLGTGEIAGFEALMRLVHPIEGTIAPGGIIRIAEETGSIGRALGGGSSAGAAPNRRPPMTTTNSKKHPRRMAREAKADAVVAPDQAQAPAVSPRDEAQLAPPKRPSKTEAVLTLLKRPEGATLGELVAATGWLPHTTRAAMAGLKKKGHQVTRTKVDGVSRYIVAESAAQ